MSLTTHVFKVGDGDFVVSHSNGVMVINDAGYGAYRPEGVAWTQENPTPLGTAFSVLLHENKIHTVHTVMSHQHGDHCRLLEPGFEEIKAEQRDRERLGWCPLNVGRIIVGWPCLSNIILLK